MEIKIDHKKLSKIINKELERWIDDSGVFEGALYGIIYEFVNSKEFKDHIKAQLKKIQVNVKPVVQTYTTKVTREQ